MKYTKEQRLDIGRRIYDGEITKYDAAQQYDISHQTARMIMVLPETARRDPRRGEIPVMRIRCPLLSDFPVAGARRNKLQN